MSKLLALSFITSPVVMMGGVAITAALYLHNKDGKKKKNYMFDDEIRKIQELKEKYPDYKSMRVFNNKWSDTDYPDYRNQPRYKFKFGLNDFYHNDHERFTIHNENESHEHLLRMMSNYNDKCTVCMIDIPKDATISNVDINKFITSKLILNPSKCTDIKDFEKFNDGKYCKKLLYLSKYIDISENSIKKVFDMCNVLSYEDYVIMEEELNHLYPESVLKIVDIKKSDDLEFFTLLAIKENPIIIKFIDNTLKTKEFYNKASTYNYNIIKYIEKADQTEFICNNAIGSIYNICFMDEKFLTSDLYEKYYNQLILDFDKILKEEYIDEYDIKIMLLNFSYLKLQTEKQSETIYSKYSIATNGKIIHYIINQTPEMCYNAVTKNGENIKYCKHLTTDICNTALMESVENIYLIPPKSIKLENLIYIDNRYSNYVNRKFKAYFGKLSWQTQREFRSYLRSKKQ